MKKHLLLIFITVLGYLLAPARDLNIDGVNYRVDTLENHQVGPGTDYIALRLTTSKKRLDVFFLKADLKNPHIDVRTALGQDSIYSGERPSRLAKRKSTEGAFYFAGTNGDFYITSGYVGYPVSGSIVDGEIARIPGNRSVVAFDDKKMPYIGIMSYSGRIRFADSEVEINSVNHLREANQVVLYNRHNGKYTRSNAYGTEILIELQNGESWGSNKNMKAKVLKIEKNIGNMAIPPGKAVISAHGRAAAKLEGLKVGSDLEINLGLTMDGKNDFNITGMSGGDPHAIMLKDGVIEQANVWNELHPRTGLGYSQKKDSLIFCVVDGRGLSNGASTKQLAYIMKSAGAYTAFNMDGGGSSCMYVAEYGGPVNRPSDSSGERAVSNSIFLVSTAPADEQISSIKAHQSSVTLAEFGTYTPKFYGYNRYGVLVNPDLKDVTLSCPETMGTISGNTFMATSTAGGTLTASYKGSNTVHIAVRIVPAGNISMSPNPLILDKRSDYTLQIMTQTEQGEMPMSPSAFEWSVEDAGICQVTNGVVKALRNGETNITARRQDISATVQVKVQTPASARIIDDYMKAEDWKLSGSDFFENLNWGGSNLPGGWQHGASIAFKNSLGLGPFIKLTSQKKQLFGLPDSIIITLNTDRVKVSEFSIWIKAKNQKKPISSKFKNIEGGKDISLSIAIDDLFDSKDRGIYPLTINSMQFAIETDKMTEGETYTLFVKDINLAYRNMTTTGLNTIKGEDEALSIYPNPVHTPEIFIRPATQQLQMLKAELYSMAGQKIAEKQYGNYAGGSVVFPLAMLEQGTYLLKIYEDGKQSTKLIIKP